MDAFKGIPNLWSQHGVLQNSLEETPKESLRTVHLPEHVEDLSVGVDPDEDVGHGDELELGVLGVGEVDLGLPDGLDEVGVVEVERLLDVVVVEPLVHPRLPQVQVHLVVLRGRGEGKMLLIDKTCSVRILIP